MADTVFDWISKTSQVVNDKVFGGAKWDPGSTLPDDMIAKNGIKPDKSKVVFYNDANFGPPWRSFPIPHEQNSLSKGVWGGGLNKENDTYSSLTVPPGVVVTAYNDSEQRGTPVVFGPGEYPNLGKYGLNDKISSFTTARQGNCPAADTKMYNYTVRKKQGDGKYACPAGWETTGCEWHHAKDGDKQCRQVKPAAPAAAPTPAPAAAPVVKASTAPIQSKCMPVDKNKYNYITRKKQGSGPYACPPKWEDTGCQWKIDGNNGDKQCRQLKPVAKPAAAPTNVPVGKWKDKGYKKWSGKSKKDAARVQCDYQARNNQGAFKSCAGLRGKDRQKCIKTARNNCLGSVSADFVAFAGEVDKHKPKKLGPNDYAIIVYELKGFKGRSKGFKEGSDAYQGPSVGFPIRSISISTVSPHKFVANEKGWGGRSKTFTKSVKYVGKEWDGFNSSLKTFTPGNFKIFKS